MSNVTVQEALKAAQKVICEGIYSDDGMDGEDGKKALLAIEAALAEIDKCEPVGELILDPVFLPALKAPLVNWKINLVDLEVGTKFYTSPQPIEKCEPVAYGVRLPDGRIDKSDEPFYFEDEIENKLNNCIEGCTIAKLYTSPQPREWVNLTNMQITNIGMQHQSLHQVAYAISDALKQLNTKG